MKMSHKGNIFGFIRRFCIIICSISLAFMVMADDNAVVDDGFWVKVPDFVGSTASEVKKYADGLCDGLNLISLKDGYQSPIGAEERAKIVASVNARHGYIWMPRKASTVIGRTEEALDKISSAAGKVETAAKAVKNAYDIGKIIGIAAGSNSIDEAVDTYVSEGMIQNSVAGEAGYWLGTLAAGIANGKSITEAIAAGYDEKNVGKIAKTGYDTTQWLVRFATDMPDTDETCEDIMKRTRYEYETQLKTPKVGLIQDITPYEDTVDMLGFDNSKGDYLILLEDYTFKDYDGNEYTIPAGFIYDGTSLPTAHDKGFWATIIGFGTQVLMPDQTRFSSLAEGLIHDYMYRYPNQFTKEKADRLLFSNLKANENQRASEIYKGVRLGGSSAYDEHKVKTDNGTYNFTPEYYKHNLEIYYGKTTDGVSGEGDAETDGPSDDGNGQMCSPEDQPEEEEETTEKETETGKEDDRDSGDDIFDTEPGTSGGDQMCPIPTNNPNNGSNSSKRRRTSGHRGNTSSKIW